MDYDKCKKKKILLKKFSCKFILSCCSQIGFICLCIKYMCIQYICYQVRNLNVDVPREVMTYPIWLILLNWMRYNCKNWLAKITVPWSPFSPVKNFSLLFPFTESLSHLPNRKKNQQTRVELDVANFELVFRTKHCLYYTALHTMPTNLSLSALCLISLLFELKYVCSWKHDKNNISLWIRYVIIKPSLDLSCWSTVWS